MGRASYTLPAMRAAPLLLTAVLLAGSAALGRSSDERRAAPRAAPGAASLLGGFTAIAVQVLWMRADQAVFDHREDDALVAFAAINELEPQLVSAGQFIASAIGFTLAAGHEDPALRWAMGREGWRVLCRTVGHNPAEARAYGARARYALLRLSGDPPMRAGFVREIDKAGPLEAAIRDAEEALRLRPQWLEPRQLLALASMGRGREHLAAGEFAEAARRFGRAAEALLDVAATWRAAGGEELADSAATNEENAALARALVHVCGLPPGERAREYEDLRRTAGAAMLPDLPKR